MKAFFLTKKVLRLLMLLIMLLNGQVLMSAFDDMDGCANWDFGVNNLRYKITSTEKMEVGVIGTGCSSYDELEIPATVVWENSNYTVTSILDLKYMYREYFSMYEYIIRLDDPWASSIYIPATISEINSSAFAISNLTEIKIDPQNPIFKTIDGILYDKNVTTIIAVPKGITECEIPNTITKTGIGTFSYCSMLRSIKIPDSIEEISDSTFYGCTDLELPKIPNTVKYIGDYAFYGCNHLEYTELPSNLEYIGEDALGECRSITELDIPQSVSFIGDNAFSKFYNLKRINVDSRNNSYKDLNGVLFNKDLTRLVLYPRKMELKEYAIPNTVKEIANNAFNGCKALESIAIPASVTNIGHGAFSGCSKLSNVSLSASITEIKESTFSRTSLNSVDIPSSVTDIGKYAFSSCEELTSVLIPPSVEKIGYMAFSSTSLKSVDLPSSVTEIDDYAFRECKELTTVSIPPLVEKIGVGVFTDCVQLSSVTISNGVTEIPNYTFHGCSSLREIIIPKSVLTIGFGVFEEVLRTIKFECEMPPSINQNFRSTSFRQYDIDIYVPKGSLSAYENAFRDISGYDKNFHEVDEWGAGISEISADGQDTLPDVYTPQGICVKRGATKADIDVLPKGLYIIGGKKVLL